MSGHGLKAVAIQYSWLREPGFALMGFVALKTCLLYISDAADERSSVDLGGRRFIKKKNNIDTAP